MNNTVEVNGIMLSDRAITIIKFLQSENNYMIKEYKNHIDHLTDILFKIADGLDVDFSNDEFLEMLRINHSLRKDLADLSVIIQE